MFLQVIWCKHRFIFGHHPFDDISSEKCDEKHHLDLELKLYGIRFCHQYNVWSYWITWILNTFAVHHFQNASSTRRRPSLEKSLETKPKKKDNTFARKQKNKKKTKWFDSLRSFRPANQKRPIHGTARRRRPHSAPFKKKSDFQIARPTAAVSLLIIRFPARQLVFLVTTGFYRVFLVSWLIQLLLAKLGPFFPAEFWVWMRLNFGDWRNRVKLGHLVTNAHLSSETWSKH